MLSFLLISVWHCKALCLYWNNYSTLKNESINLIQIKAAVKPQASVINEAIYLIYSLWHVILIKSNVIFKSNLCFAKRSMFHEKHWFLVSSISEILGMQMQGCFNPLSAIFTKWSNTIKQFFGKLPTNCLNVFDHFVGLVLKGLISVHHRCNNGCFFFSQLYKCSSNPIDILERYVNTVQNVKCSKDLSLRLTSVFQKVLDLV